MPVAERVGHWQAFVRTTQALLDQKVLAGDAKKIEESCQSTFVECNSQLVQSRGIDCAMSGTTDTGCK